MDKRITEFGPNGLFRNAFKPVDKVIYDNNIDVIKNILFRCQHIKYLNFEFTRICPNKNGNLLLEIAKLCPKLERIKFNNSLIYLNDNEWEQFSESIAPKLIGCNIFLNNKSEDNIKFIRILLKHFKLIESLELNTWDYKWDQQLFDHLNSYENLKKLVWNYKSIIQSHKITDQNAVFQRLNYLKTNYNQFVELNCKMDNLIKLKLSFDDDYYPIDNHLKQMDEIEFPNLKMLFFNNLSSGQLKSISKLKFPNLNFLHITYNIHEECNFNEDQQIFAKLFKNVNQLYCSNISLALTEQFNSFVSLTKLTYECEYMSIDDHLTAFDIITKHKSLEEITISEISFFDDRIDLMRRFFDGIIKFGQEKSNARISISMGIIENEENKTFVNNYIQEFVLNNWHVSDEYDFGKVVLYLKK